MDPASFSTFGPAMGLGAGLAMVVSVVVSAVGWAVERRKAQRLQALVDQMEADAAPEPLASEEVSVGPSGAVPVRPPRQAE